MRSVERVRVFEKEPDSGDKERTLDFVLQVVGKTAMMLKENFADKVSNSQRVTDCAVRLKLEPGVAFISSEVADTCLQMTHNSELR